jgi:hypothetical protein
MRSTAISTITLQRVQLQDYTTDHARLLAAVTGYLPQELRPPPLGFEGPLDGLIEPAARRAPPPPAAKDEDSATVSLGMRKASMAAALNKSDDLQRAAESVRSSLKTQRQSFDRNGALMAQAIPLVPGAVKLSIIVRDTASGHAGSLSLPLDRLQEK